MKPKVQGGLTAAQEAYCQARATGLSTTEAYRKAFPASRGNDATLKREAAKLEKRGGVKQRVAELVEAATKRVTEKVAEEFAITKATIVKELWENSQIAKAAKPVLDREGHEIGEYTANIAASNSALALIGKELGMFRDVPPPPDDPLENLSHEDKKALKALLEESIGAGDEPRAGGTTTGRRKARTTH